MARTPLLWLSLTAATLLCQFFNAEAKPIDEPPLHFPLLHNQLFKRNATASILRARSKYAQYFVTALDNQTGGKVPMTDYEYDIEYYGTLSVGTPPQEVKLDFDTGSADLWFAGTECIDCGVAKTRFHHLLSSTFHKPNDTKWEITYGDGSTAGGYVGYDTVNLGGYAIKQQAIELATKRSSTFSNEPIDGILGLAFNSIATVNGIRTPMDNLVSQGLIKKPIFGVFLGKASENGGGEFIFGGYNPDHFTGSLTTVPVDNSNGFWGVTVDTLTVNKKVIARDVRSIVDTGTTLLVLADDVADAVAAAYGATANIDGTYMIDCDTSKFAPLEFELGGASFQVPPDSLIYTEDNGRCFAGFARAGLPFNIIGDVFIKNNYIVFNTQVPELQIAPSKA